MIWTVLPDVRYYEYIPFEDGVILHIEDSTPEDYVYASCLYYCGTDGTRKLLDHNIGKYGNVYFNLQVSDGSVYFSNDPGSDQGPQIYQINLDTGEKTLCCVIPSLYCFQVYGGKLYLGFWGGLGGSDYDGKFSQAELDGSEMKDLVFYQDGGEQNVLDIMAPMEMGRDERVPLSVRIFLCLPAANGSPASRSGQDRQEKVFFYGEWLTPTEFTQAYYAIPFHPQDA